VKYPAWDELLQQVLRLVIAQLVQPRPQLFALVDFLHSDAGGLRARLQQPWPRHAIHEFAQIFVIQHVDEFRNQDTRFPGPHAHRKFVAKIMHRGQAHSGQPQMLANGGDVFQVKFIQRHDAINLPAAGRITHRMQQILQRELIGHEKHFVDGFARPIAFAKFFDGQKINCAAQALTRAQEVLPLFIRGDTQDGDGTIRGHGLFRACGRQVRRPCPQINCADYTRV